MRTKRILGTNAERFWPKVAVIQDEKSCWLWCAGKNTGGYGAFGMRDDVTGASKVEGAHRASWIMHFGAIPEGLWVLHRCDVPSCVRPEHLFLGTPEDNEQDKIQKGRKPKPGKHKSQVCRNGHPRIRENQFIKKGGDREPRLECVLCARDRDRKRSQNRRRRATKEGTGNA